MPSRRLASECAFAVLVLFSHVAAATVESSFIVLISFGGKQTGPFMGRTHFIFQHSFDGIRVDLSQCKSVPITTNRPCVPQTLGPSLSEEAMALKLSRLELARDPDFPEGSRRHGYELVAPLDETDHLAPTEWHTHRDRCRARRFWAGEEQMGLLVRRPGGAWGVPRQDLPDGLS